MTGSRRAGVKSPASYVSHQSERPMQIVWRLDHEIPADFYHVAAVAAG